MPKKLSTLTIKGQIQELVRKFSNGSTCGAIDAAYLQKMAHRSPDLRTALARIFHSAMNQRSGESVKRLDITQPNENATHRFFDDRL